MESHWSVEVNFAALTNPRGEVNWMQRPWSVLFDKVNLASRSVVDVPRGVKIHSVSSSSVVGADRLIEISSTPP